MRVHNFESPLHSTHCFLAERATIFLRARCNDSWARVPHWNSLTPPRCCLSTAGPPRDSSREREFFIDNLLVRIHLIMSQMFLVDRPRAMGV